MKQRALDCEFLVGNRFCKAIESEEGKSTRENSCTNRSKNSCCYLCNNQDLCAIGCNYLVKPEDMSEFNERIEQKIKDCRAKIENLSLLFADGKIGEQSYADSVKAIERKIDDLNKSKSNPLTSPHIYSLDESVEHEEKPTAFWYVVPFFFAILGGIVAYVGTKDRDKGMANRLLIFGIIWSVLEPVLVWLVVIFLLSLL